ncbi:hypothetical protein Z043_104597 [Scleropages formosus]|uniref:Uncharacterized protein n=1 Tax=Scleropages formosus TaxID=113540 RepID=A0A0P7UNH9_SCLFO|nr:hypothetical protein Z043_104597 [Scleropages formosus]
MQQTHDMIMERPQQSEQDRTNETNDEITAVILNLNENEAGEKPETQALDDEVTNEFNAKKLDDTETSHTPNFPTCDVGKFRNKESLPKSCTSSVQVMKALLSSKLDRCNSLPEVSPTYGRKLSTSARGLLDCLANLQLIDSELSNNAKDEKYKELMDILQSLWLSEPTNSEQEKQQKELNKHHSVDDEFNHRSSSGVDVSSGSAGSGKSSLNGGVVRPKKTGGAAQNDTEGMVTDLDALQEENEDEESLKFSPKSVLDTDFPAAASDPATPDIACRVLWSPTSEGLGPDEEKQVEVEGPPSDETIQSNGSPREILETPSSKKSSGNFPEETESSSMTSAPLTRKLSQDPDPLWVLTLLNKIEKQFMKHYVNAMEELKGRWNLDENEQFDIMINELQAEVQKRIQSSIDRELLKIKSRAGRPRPPKEAMSRELTVQTEQRRRRLKVMYNKSIDTPVQKSEEDNTVTGTEFSDQRSEDEYCPCETCVKKKMISRPMALVACTSSAPVMIDFDLRKILQLKKTMSTDIQEKEYEEDSFDRKEGTGIQDENDFKDLEEEVENEEDEQVHLVKTQATNKECMEKETVEEEESRKMKKSVGEMLEIISENTKDCLIQEKKSRNTKMEEEFERTPVKKMAFYSETAVEAAKEFQSSDECEEDKDNKDDDEDGPSEAVAEAVQQSEVTDESQRAEGTATEDTETAEDNENFGEGETEEISAGEVANVLETENESSEMNESAEEDETGAEVNRALEENTAEHETMDDDVTTKYETETIDFDGDTETANKSEAADDCKSDAEIYEGKNSRNEISQNDDMDEHKTSEEGEVKIKEDETTQDEQTTESPESNDSDSETSENEQSKVFRAAEAEIADSGTVKEEGTSDDDAVLQNGESMDAEDNKTGTGTSEDKEAVETTESTEDENSDTEKVETVEEGETSVDGGILEVSEVSEGRTPENKQSDEDESENSEAEAKETTANEAESTESEENKDTEEAEDKTASDDETNEGNEKTEDDTAEDKSYSDEAEEAEIDTEGNIDEEDADDENVIEKTETLEPETGEDCEHNEAESFEESEESETTGDVQTDTKDDTAEGDLSETERSENIEAEKGETDKEEASTEDEVPKDEGESVENYMVKEVDEDEEVEEQEDNVMEESNIEDTDNHDEVSALQGDDEFEEEEEPKENKLVIKSDDLHDKIENDVTEYTEQTEQDEVENINCGDKAQAIVVEEGRETIQNEGAVNETKDDHTAISEEVDTETANEDTMLGNQGESAEAEDEAEDGSEGEHGSDGSEDAVTGRDKGEECKVEVQNTPFNITLAENIEYEDGAEADVEDSETEVYNAKLECICAESETMEDPEFKQISQKDESVMDEGNKSPKKENHKGEEVEQEEEEDPEQGSTRLSKSSIETQTGSVEETND